MSTTTLNKKSFRKKAAMPLALFVALSGGAATTSLASSASAAGTCNNQTAVNATNENGGNTLGAGDAAKINVNLTNLDGCDAGMQTVVQIPKELTMGQIGKVVPLTDKNGNLIANATIGADNVTIVLTDFASTHQKVNANFEIWANATDALNTTDDVTLTWTVNGQTTTTVVKGQPSVGVPKGTMPDEVGKGGSYNSDTDIIRVGARSRISQNGGDIAVHEELTSGGQMIDCGNLNISASQFSNVDSKSDPTDERSLDYSVTNCSATSLDLVVRPDKGSVAQLYFDTKVTNSSAGAWNDTVTFQENGGEPSSSSAHVINYGASGGGSGEVIPLPPTDTPTDTPSTPTDTPTTDTPSETPTTPTDTPTTDVPSDTPTTDTPSTEPTQPTEPSTTEPTTPTSETTEPTTPPTTDTPSDNPTTPATSDTPTAPATSDTPSTPATPTAPATSTTPATPTTPGNPGSTTTEPTKPSTPSTGTDTSTGAPKPGTGTNTGTPSTSGTPSAPNTKTKTNPKPGATTSPTKPGQVTGPKVQTDKAAHDNGLSTTGVGIGLTALVVIGGIGSLIVRRERTNN